MLYRKFRYVNRIYSKKYKTTNFFLRIIFNKFFSLIIIATIIKIQIINEASILHGNINLSYFIFNPIPIKENIRPAANKATKDLLKSLNNAQIKTFEMNKQGKNHNQLS